MDFMDFSDALVACKQGQKITRSDWNGADQYVVFQKGYPDGIPLNKNTAEATGLDEGTVCRFAPYFMLRNAQGVFVPWLPTQGDLVSESWTIFV